ncbi:hypothetical protein AB0C51_00210 [Streptomyces pathocidini]|uniref:hypothetical protein n=1 Tax=Streptomyces pathocidini TaxID=1650571 RepID=UPI0033C4430A
MTSAYNELAADMAKAIGGLRRHLDEIVGGMRENARNTEAADEAMEDMFKGFGR